MNHRVIVTADDFGACEYIDNGIREAIKKGVVSSVSAFVNFHPRKKSHPWGKYKGSIQAIKGLLHDLENHPDYKNNRDVRIGLHLNFHAGSPVSDPSEVRPLLLKTKQVVLKKKYNRQNEVKKIKEKKKKLFVKVDGQEVFKTIERFDPDQISTPVFRKELYAQYNKFCQELSFDPDHVSSHFPIVFMTPRFFKEVCQLVKNEAKDGKPPVPVRNPFLIWQTNKKWASKEEKKKLKNMKKFWKKRSQTKKINFKTALAMADTVFDTILNGWRKKNIKELVNNQIDFPDYTNCYLYGNGQRSYALNNMLSNLPVIRPTKFKKPAEKPLSTEIVIHLGKGKFDPAQVPSGINADYFKGRNEELKCVTGSDDLVKRKLFHYKSALQA